MIIRTHILKGIKQGTIKTVFRVWDRPRVKKGTLMHTAVGQVQINEVSPVELDDIDPDLLKRSGTSHSELNRFRQLRSGQLFRIDLSFAGEDPRIALRQNTDLTEDEIIALAARFDKWDKSSPYGPWTRKVFQVIETHPATRAQDIADQLGFEKDWLKTQIRKLKNLGLTESLEVGYEISPRGSVLLSRLSK